MTLAPFTPTPGEWIDGLPNEAYHAAAGHSSTYLRTALRKSPWYAAEQRRRGHVETASQAFGTMAHTAILEPEALESRYLFAPGIDARTKAGKERLAELEAEAAASGRQLLREEPDAVVQLQKDAHSHPVVRAVFQREHHVERSLWWKDEASGLLLKARPDLYVPDWSETHGLMADLKSSQDCLKPAFQRSVARYGYAQQAAQYVAGFEALHGKPCHFAWIVVEASEPHEVSVFFADEWMASGEADFRKACELVARCERTGVYPRAYGGKAVVLEMPSWAQNGENDE